MDIKDLIERILESTSSVIYSHFTFILEDTNAKSTCYAVDYRGNRVAVGDYFGLSTETHQVVSVDDAVTFLFDCDIHLWELVSYEIDASIYGPNSKHWRITLKR